MESRNFYHLDHKPSNILYDDVLKILMICDFGTSSFYFDKDRIKSCTVKGLSLIYASPEERLSLIYASPEVLDQAIYNDGTKIYQPAKCDIFSLGVTLLRCYLGIKYA